MDGGPTRFGRIEPMGGAAVNAGLARLCGGIEEFRVLAASRLASVATSGARSSDDRAYDAPSSASCSLPTPTAPPWSARSAPTVTGPTAWV